MALEEVKISQLKKGDIVWSHGMRLRCGEFEVSKSHPVADDGSLTRWCKGTVLNPEEVKAAGHVPVSWWKNGWTIQSNDLARWTRESNAGWEAPQD